MKKKKLNKNSKMNAVLTSPGDLHAGDQEGVKSITNKAVVDRFGKPIENKQIDLILSGPGWLKTADQEGVVQFLFCSEDRGFPRIGDIYCDQAVVNSAWDAGYAVLSAFGTKVRVEVAGVNMQNGALTVYAAPVFRALAKQMKNAA